MQLLCKKWPVLISRNVLCEDKTCNAACNNQKLMHHCYFIRERIIFPTIREAIIYFACRRYFYFYDSTRRRSRNTIWLIIFFLFYSYSFTNEVDHAWLFLWTWEKGSNCYYTSQLADPQYEYWTSKGTEIKPHITTIQLWWHLSRLFYGIFH